VLIQLQYPARKLKKQIKKIIKQNLKADGYNILVEEMSEREDEYEKNVELLRAFVNGFGI